MLELQWGGAGSAEGYFTVWGENGIMSQNKRKECGQARGHAVGNEMRYNSDPIHEKDVRVVL